MGLNPLFPSPFLGNTSCADYHRFSLGDLHEAWNMNTPAFYPTSQTWDVKYTAAMKLVISSVKSCCKHVGTVCDPCPKNATDVMRAAIAIDEPGHLSFSVARAGAPLE